MANIYGRQVVVPLTNKSGGQVIAGDVVVVDSTNNDAFTTSTAGAVTTGVGVAQETIASNATGRILIGGYAALINVNASVTRGNYGKTYTVAKQATDAGSSRVAGTFCQFLTGGTTPDAYVYQPDLGGASLTDPTTTEGDLIYRTSGALARLAVGATANMALASNGTDPVYKILPGTLLGVTYNTAGGNKTTTSSTAADVDATNAIVTFTAPASGNILVCVSCAYNMSGVNANTFLGLRESTTDLVNASGSPKGTEFAQGQTATALESNLFWVAYLTGVSAGSHTYKLSFATNAGSFVLRAAAGAPMTIWVLAN